MPVGDLNEMAGGLALCTSCFTGTYPMDVPDGEIKTLSSNRDDCVRLK